MITYCSKCFGHLDNLIEVFCKPCRNKAKTKVRKIIRHRNEINRLLKRDAKQEESA